MLVNAKVQRDFIHAQAERFHEFLQRISPGRTGGILLAIRRLLVVINDFDVQCFALAP